MAVPAPNRSVELPRVRSVVVACTRLAVHMLRLLIADLGPLMSTRPPWPPTTLHSSLAGRTRSAVQFAVARSALKVPHPTSPPGPPSPTRLPAAHLRSDHLLAQVSFGAAPVLHRSRPRPRSRPKRSPYLRPRSCRHPACPSGLPCDAATTLRVRLGCPAMPPPPCVSVWTALRCRHHPACPSGLPCDAATTLRVRLGCPRCRPRTTELLSPRAL